MQLDFSSDKPIFLQIAEGLEDAILSGAFAEGEQIPSITEFAVTYTINPATALKGINLLVDQGILFKKRGIGMFVSENALDMLRVKRRQSFYETYITSLVEEARRLALTKEDVEALIGQGFEERRSNHGN
ncbi:GntR family transcriptional regulator [Eubacteriales bacterium OttesenSCG-928-N13]|nr:GntR family transcriptional regulator [Eubacteriales bacterium OttesenSCG-928-N13]